MQKNNILITVLMSVYNTNPTFLKEAIDSILNQTYQHFEFIIIDDCSNSLTKKTLQSYRDKRIKIIINDKNIGLTKSLNKGLRQARGKYIARMDADDISHPNRLLEQLKYMERNTDITVLGSHTQNLSSGKVNLEHWSKNTELIRIRLLFCNAGMAHPTAFFRREHLTKFKINYDESIEKTQDYAMWVNIVQYGKMDILPKVLLKYRIHNKQISIDKRKDQLYYEKLIMRRQFKAFKKEFYEDEIDALVHFYNGNFICSANYLNQVLTNIIDLNNTHKIYNPKLFNKEINRIWFITSFKRLLKIKKIDMLFNIRTLQIFIPNNFVHLLKYVLTENSKVRVVINRIINKEKVV